ncbi:MAG: T9SS type A sorting domain-containing protein [Bacteroidetes bacterium]|nr:T9SS type A sorting domain-containing protein [Bacteroidota bacterium]
MKKMFLLLLVFGLTTGSFAQFNALMKKQAHITAPVPVIAADLPVAGAQTPNPIVSNKSIMDDPIVSQTRYDLQSNYTNQRRIYYFPDGTMGTAVTWSTQDASWTDRGTGYNYYDGGAWGPLPTARVETSRTGWPNYLPFEVDGEIIVAHQAIGPLVINKRVPKGTGAWTQSLMPALPSNITAMFWPRAVTNGPNHTYIHIIAMTLPTGNGGQTYNGMDGALLYCHSLDGGATWTPWTQLPGTDGSVYTNFTADTYSWADPHGDTLAFACGESWMDQFIMKSLDNGTTWTKTIVHQSLYNLGGNSPNFFYCPDNTMSLALDNSNKVHLVFGLQCDSGSPTAGYYRPYTQGIVYWNEDMPQLRQDLDPDSLYANGQYVAWVKDTMVFYPPSGVSYSAYYTSLTSNPELIIDKDNRVFLVWAGETSLVDPNSYMLRHIYGRFGYINSGVIMWTNDTLTDLTGDWIQYNFAECMYPSATPALYCIIKVLFQRDDYGGSYVKGMNVSGYLGQTSPDDNYMTVISWMPCTFGIGEKQAQPTFSVAQNYPNPVNGMTTIDVYLQNPGNLSLEVTNLAGQSILRMEKTNVLPGMSQFVLDGSTLSPGVYFYTVKQAGQSITKKMVVQ